MNTDKDNLFENLTQLADALALQFAPFCEVVIHDLDHPDSSIVHISGDITGRHIGGPMTDFVLGLLEHENDPEDVVGYIAHARDGKTLKSSTIFIRDETGAPIGVFCINFDLSPLLTAEQEVKRLTQASTSVEVDKSFSTDVPNLLQEMIQKSLRRVLKTSNLQDLNGNISTDDRKAIVADLHDQGAFRIQKATSIVADLFDVSRYTIYKDRNALDD